ncbi:hypothetical protein [Salibacterium sp. K-3]
MTYWLISAVDPERKRTCNVKVEHQSIAGRDRYHYERTMRMDAGGFVIRPAASALGGKVESFLEADAGVKWTSLIKKGVTTVLLLMRASSRGELKERERSINRQLDSPIDYLLVPSIPSRKLTPSFIRWITLNDYPLIEITFSSYEDCSRVSWDWIRQAVGPSSLSLMFRFPPTETLSDIRQKTRWENLLSTLFPVLPFDSGPLLNKKELQICGLYPDKGSLVRGDADYLLYYNTEQTMDVSWQYWYADRDPDVVVMRGQVLKAGEDRTFFDGTGKCRNDILPGRLRSIQHA